MKLLLFVLLSLISIVSFVTTLNPLYALLNMTVYLLLIADSLRTLCMLLSEKIKR